MADKTLGDVPGLTALLKPLGAPTEPPAREHPLGAVDADEAGLGETTFDNPNGNPDDSAVGALTFDNATPVVDPMASLHMPTLKRTTTTTGGWRDEVVAAARKMLGTPYVWGGTSYSGVDCSGLVQLAFKAAGRAMPRISAQQARVGQRVKLNALKPGDLVAWDNSSRNNGADHIAIYIGNGLIIEAPRPGRNVQIAHISDQSEAWGVSLD